MQPTSDRSRKVSITYAYTHTRAYGTAGRVNDTMDVEIIDFGSLSHMVLFVQIPDPPNSPSTAIPQTYLVDLGFGLGGPVKPLLLKEDETISGSVPIEKHRLTKAPFPHSSLDSSDEQTKSIAEDWVVQSNLDAHGNVLSEGRWRTLYQFGTMEFFLRDFEALSFVVAHRPRGLFWDRILAVASVPEGDGGSMARLVLSEDGRVMQYGTDGPKVLRELKSERDRIDALKECFGIHIDEGGEEFVRPVLKLNSMHTHSA